MRKILVSLILLQVPTISSFPQLLDKIKKATNISNTNDVLKYVQKQTVDYLQKSRDEYDATDFNYAVSFSDNSALYETEEKFGRTKKTLLYALSPESLDKRSKKEEAGDYNDVGEIMYASGRYKTAESSFNQALDIYKNNGMGESANSALVISNLGLLYHTTGRYFLADSFTRHAMKMRIALGNDQKGLGASLNNLGVLYRDMGRYNEAEDTIAKAVDIIKNTEGDKSAAYAIVLNNQAILYQTTGKYKESEQLLLKAIDIAGHDLGKKSPNFVRMKVNLALLYQLENRYNDAERIYLEAIDIKKKRLGTNHPDYAILLRNLAALYQLKGQFDKVESYLKQAIDIYKSKFGVQHPSYAAAIYELGRYYQYFDKTDKALPLLTEAIGIQKTVLGEHHPAYISTLESLAILQWQTNNIPQAAETYNKVMNEYLYQVKVYFPPMSEYDKSRFWENIHPKFIRYNSFVVDAQYTMPSLIGDMYNYHIATKALLLNSSNKVKDRILLSSDNDLIDRYKQWLNEKEYISKLYTFSKEELNADKINLDSLEGDANKREKELSKSSEAFSQAFENKTTTFADIESLLNANETAIEIIRFRHYNKMKADTAVYYGSLCITKNNSLPKLIVFKNGNELETIAAKAYRKSMQNGTSGRNFFNIYWDKLEEATSSTPNLFISVDGIYNQINLNTLQKENGKFLIDEKNIVLLSNTKNLVKSRKNVKISTPFIGKKAELFGDPDYAKDLDLDKVKTMTLPELPGTRIEIERIKEQLQKGAWKTNTYFGDMATKENLRSVKNPTVLHIATHGFFLTNIPDKKDEKVFGIEPLKAAENPLLRSGLMFAGADNTIQQLESKGHKNSGILNAYEAMLLDLDKTELVVLSACETGLGEIINGEGVYGLQRAFEVAGAKNIMISLWQVSDEVTQKLMVAFYRNWLLNGNKQSAFTKAQIEIKKQYSAPFYWGAFVMVGD